MENLLNIEIGGIKCDAEGCDYHDDDAKFENYEEYVNKPCPKCGANLLTQEDMDAAKQLIEMAGMLNEMGAEMQEAFPGVDFDAEPRVELELKMKGDGSVEVGEIK